MKRAFIKLYIINEKIDLIEIPAHLVYLLDNLEPTLKEKIILRIGIDFSKEWYSILNQLNASLNDWNYKNIKIVKFYNKNSLLDLDLVKRIFNLCNEVYPELLFGAHFYLSHPVAIKDLFTILYSSRSNFLEVSINGRAQSNVGFLPPTEKIVTYLTEVKNKSKFNMLSFESSYNTAKKIFSRS